MTPKRLRAIHFLITFGSQRLVKLRRSQQDVLRPLPKYERLLSPTTPRLVAVSPNYFFLDLSQRDHRVSVRMLMLDNRRGSQ